MPKSKAELMKLSRQRRRDLGFLPVSGWVHKDDIDQVNNLITKLNSLREAKKCGTQSI